MYSGAISGGTFGELRTVFKKGRIQAFRIQI